MSDWKEGGKSPERVELFVVQYRNKDGRPSSWQAVLPLRDSAEACRQDFELARDVWQKESRIVRIIGEVVPHA